ncbi:MAG: hypothetical protein AAGK47_07425 [Bacteroidota bacterium]
MKKLLEKQVVFNSTLQLFAFFARRTSWNRLTAWCTRQSAKLNIMLNRPAPAQTTTELAQAWQQMMPPDGQHFFKIAEVTPDTAFAEIHIHCPLRGTGDAQACHRLMNYDRTLVDAVGGQLVVLSSQANNGTSFCRLAIRHKDADVQDLRAAHE